MVYLPTSVRTFLVGPLMVAAWSILALSGTAAAQTVVLYHPTQVTDTAIRSGSYTNTNFDGQVLAAPAAASTPFSSGARSSNSILPTGFHQVLR